jgi:hypothetical protein
LLKLKIVVPAELNITMKQVDSCKYSGWLRGYFSMEMTIEESLRMSRWKKKN